MNMMVPSAPPKKRTFDEANLDAKPSGDDNSSDKLPKKLRDMFLPLTCKLCKVTATSNMMAKAHYTGKPHEKRVRQFLEKWSEETGNPMPKISKPETKLSQDASYCKTCDITLTSVSVAQQHYAGKNHYKAFTQGKKHKAQTVVEVNDGRFGIGKAFLPNVATESVHQLPSDDISIESPIKHRMQPVESKSSRLANDIKKKLFSWSCDLCGVIAHSEDQLNMHLKGAKHLKAIKRSQTPSIIPAPANPSESILASVIHPEKNVTDYSMFRTPSGQYYCQPCNVSVNSPEQMSQHVESKKHKFKYACAKSKKNEFNGIKIPVEKNYSNPHSALSDKV
ncbi:zinc finger matrin-type protein 3 isoform X2 [Nilaparvata lugens]|uniref:zinc finger matrin-type protein 3 isoform X2 n=1 Tax=Nilaparvata lugens TaxID=108931 RepID=UPI00193CE6A8|nr:zinc finger matrin-type protein 3 isoform X2 [Nilaparvata lugens]